jgi:hypothetical protein
MQATITYLLTEQAQRAQMAATGQPVTRKQSVTVDVPTEDLVLMQVSEDGTPYLDLASGDPQREALKEMGCELQYLMIGTRNVSVHLIGDARADVLDLIRQGKAKIAARVRADRERVDAAITAFLVASVPVESECRCTHPPDTYTDVSARTDDLAKRFLAEARRRYDIYTEEQERARREKAAADARIRSAEEAKERAKEHAKAEYVASWIAGHADEQTREQFADGLLARSDAVDMIAAAAFAAAGVPEPARYCDDFCTDQDCRCGERSVTSLPLSAYPAWRLLKATLPEGYAVEFLRVREHVPEDDIDPDAEEPTAGPPMYLAKLTIPHGPFQFTRTVKLG